jgi:hypothetical protein
MTLLNHDDEKLKFKAGRYAILAAGYNAKRSKNPKLASYMRAYKETVDDEIDWDEFLDWLVENIHPQMTLCIRHSQVFFRELPEYNSEIIVKDNKDIYDEF